MNSGVFYHSFILFVSFWYFSIWFSMKILEENRKIGRKLRKKIEKKNEKLEKIGKIELQKKIWEKFKNNKIMKI